MRRAALAVPLALLAAACLAPRAHAQGGDGTGHQLVVERVELSGEPRTRPEVVERFLGLSAGAALESGDLLAGRQRLQATGFFQSLDVYARPGVRLENDLQTNGVLLDAEWCRFLKENDFLVGLSVDGPRRFHDKYRVDREGNGSFERVVEAARLLREHGVRFNTLTCVNRDNARDPLAVYRFLRDKLGAVTMQFIPIVEPVGFERTAPQHWPTDELPVLGTAAALPGTPDSFVTDWSVDPDDWGTFLKVIFDEWYRRDIGRTWVYLFESAVYTASGQHSPLCTLAPLCGKCLAVEADGSLYSCDHYVYPEYRLGNILDKPVVELAFSERQRAFAVGKQALTRLCRSCKFLTWCYGECCKNRFLRTPEGEPGHNYLCVGYKKFFNHVEERVRALAAQIAAGR